MQTIVLAAGDGTRLIKGNKYFDGVPKCMIEIGGKSLAKRIVESFPNNHPIIFVVGYNFERIFIELKGYPNVEYIINHEWLETDNSYSLYLATRFCMDDSSVINGDTIFDKEIVGMMSPDTVVVDKKKVVPEDMQVKIVDGKITELKKDLGGDGEALFYCFSENLLNKCRMDFFNNPNTHFENVVAKHMNGCLKPVYTTGYRAMEIDTPDDLRLAEAKFMGEI